MRFVVGQLSIRHMNFSVEWRLLAANSVWPALSLQRNIHVDIENENEIGLKTVESGFVDVPHPLDAEATFEVLGRTNTTRQWTTMQEIKRQTFQRLRRLEEHLYFRQLPCQYGWTQNSRIFCLFLDRMAQERCQTTIFADNFCSFSEEKKKKSPQEKRRGNLRAYCHR
jgi:hypothetical protein